MEIRLINMFDIVYFFYSYINFIQGIDFCLISSLRRRVKIPKNLSNSDLQLLNPL